MDEDQVSTAGAKGTGDYFRIEVRPKSEFQTFRYHDVGDPGGIQRLAGQRKDGSWDDHAWLINKEMAEIRDNKLVTSNSEAQEVLEEIGEIEHVKGDLFKKVNQE